MDVGLVAARSALAFGSMATRLAFAGRSVATLLALAGGWLAPLAGQSAEADGGVAEIRVGVALSGGGAKGMAHVGVLEVLEEAGVHVDVVTGTSMGSVVGGLYSIGLSTDSIRTVLADVDWPSVLGDRVERNRRLLHQRRLDERSVLRLPIDGGSIGLPAGATRGSSVTRLTEITTWPAAAIRSFDELPRTFAAVATDIETGEAVTLTGGVLSEVMRASIGIPGALEPVDVDGRLLVDGAVSRNLPAVDARALGADVVVCSDVSDALATREELGSLVDVLDQVVTLGMRSSTLAQRGLCDVLVRPDVEGISGFAFGRLDEWTERGRSAAEEHAEELRRIADRRGRAALPLSADFLEDSVRVDTVVVAGASRRAAEDLVRDELGIEPGDHVTSADLAYRLGDLDATGLFGLLRYRLDQRGEGVALTVRVEERAQDRLGVGLRYDDEHRAALLFTTTLHNLLRYGSVTRLDLRVGEETRGAISYLRHRGVTGHVEGGGTLAWSQGTLRFPGSFRPEAGVELTTLSGSLGLVAARSTFLGAELLGELTTTDLVAFPDVLLLSLSGVVDHDSRDRIDFPTRGADVNLRWEWGVTDRVPDEGFSVFTGRGRLYLPLHRRTTMDVGAYVGVARGLDLPTHRSFFVGGAHPSAIFVHTQPTFDGLRSEELTGTVAQILRAGVRWSIRSDVHVRLGVDVGGVDDAWRVPIDGHVFGWSMGVGASTLIGPVHLEWAKASTHAGGRLSVSVGRRF